jgi:2-phosphoglycolate phosphatase
MSMGRSFDTLIFDLDGTLIDSAPDVHFSVNCALKEMGAPPIDREEIRRAIGPGQDGFLKVVFPNLKKSEVNRFISIFRKYYWEHCLDRTVLFPGVQIVLSTLKDKQFAIASNKPKAFVERIITGLNIINRFRCVVGPEDVKHVKPDPEMIVKVLQLCGCEPDRALLIGDTDRDVMAGRAADVPVCGVQYGYGEIQEIKKQKPDFLIERADELIDIVNNHHH